MSEQDMQDLEVIRLVNGPKDPPPAGDVTITREEALELEELRRERKKDSAALAIWFAFFSAVTLVVAVLSAFR